MYVAKVGWGLAQVQLKAGTLRLWNLFVSEYSPIPMSLRVKGSTLQIKSVHGHLGQSKHNGDLYKQLMKTLQQIINYNFLTVKFLNSHI